MDNEIYHDCYLPNADDYTTYNKPFSIVSEDVYTGVYLDYGDIGTRICNGNIVYCDQNCDECKIDFII